MTAVGRGRTVAPTSEEGAGDPGRVHSGTGGLNATLVKTIVRSKFDGCDFHPPLKFPTICNFTGQVTCPAKDPVAVNGNWEFASINNILDYTKAVADSNLVTSTELYNLRTFLPRHMREGWTAAVRTTDFSGSNQQWFGVPPLTTGIQFRVWALCTKRAERTRLGL